MHVFIAGVIQGERRDREVENQTYRERITAVLQQRFPDITITDPWALNPGSMAYSDEQARQTFLAMTQRAAEADLLIAYLPTISMGTAMEMWQAYQAGRYIVAVTPFVHHWAIRFTANQILPDLESLLEWLENGRLPWQPL